MNNFIQTNIPAPSESPHELEELFMESLQETYAASLVLSVGVSSLASWLLCEATCIQPMEIGVFVINSFTLLPSTVCGRFSLK